jgi:hypothetical protein
MKFDLNLKRNNIPDAELFADLRRVAAKLGTQTVTVSAYDRLGHFNASTISKRFGSWLKALEAAGLHTRPSQRKNIPKEELLDNLREIWVTLARQPRYEETKAPLSRFSAGTYERCFGSWNEAMKAFIRWIDEGRADSVATEESSDGTQNSVDSPTIKRRTKRDVSPRLRFSILLRDGFRCHSCGRSPLQTPGVELHVDHIVPWSQGGETLPENLQTKCDTCNLGKGNAFQK